MVDNINNIKTKYIPFKCPVCNGWGSLSYGRKICHACKGKGYVMVNQETGEPKEIKEEKK